MMKDVNPPGSTPNLPEVYQGERLPELLQHDGIQHSLQLVGRVRPLSEIFLKRPSSDFSGVGAGFRIAGCSMLTTIQTITSSDLERSGESCFTFLIAKFWTIKGIIVGLLALLLVIMILSLSIGLTANKAAQNPRYFDDPASY